jgi:hypothetical protein
LTVRVLGGDDFRLQTQHAGADLRPELPGLQPRSQPSKNNEYRPTKNRSTQPQRTIALSSDSPGLVLGTARIHESTSSHRSQHVDRALHRGRDTVALARLHRGARHAPGAPASGVHFGPAWPHATARLNPDGLNQCEGLKVQSKLCAPGAYCAC